MCDRGGEERGAGSGGAVAEGERGEGADALFVHERVAVAAVTEKEAGAHGGAVLLESGVAGAGETREEGADAPGMPVAVEEEREDHEEGEDDGWGFSQGVCVRGEKGGMNLPTMPPMTPRMEPGWELSSALLSLLLPLPVPPMIVGVLPPPATVPVPA